jgi:hypothetical protein
LILKAVGILLEEPENVKISEIKNQIFLIWAQTVTEFNNGVEVAKIVFQNLNEEHLAEPMADFLAMLSTSYNNQVVLDNVAK